MPGKVKIISVTHQTISLKDIKHFVLEDDKAVLANRLQAIKDHFAFDEFYYLATCNRVLFLFISDQSYSTDFPHNFLLIPILLYQKEFKRNWIARCCSCRKWRL